MAKNRGRGVTMSRASNMNWGGEKKRTDGGKRKEGLFGNLNGAK